jgi:uncharacterized LabA/DUF88 family protein
MADTSGGAKREDVRVRGFVDFWNFQLNVLAWDKDFRLDWRQFGPWVAKQAGAQFIAAGQEGRIRYDGLHVYMSYDPNKPKDEKLRNWASNVLDRMPGVVVTIRERKPKDPPECPICYEPISHCPKCSGSMKRTVEKGIDTAIVTDMIRLAWEDSWDLAVLLSADRDFVPAVEFLGQKGRKVIHAAFPPQGMDLSTKCWGSFDLTKNLREVSRSDTASGSLPYR